jgi:hypothetical protein
MFESVAVQKESLPMWIARVIFAGSVAALSGLATPAVARHSDARKANDVSTASSPCQAYQMGPDGSWQQLPCREEGATAAPARRSETRSTAPESTTR